MASPQTKPNVCLMCLDAPAVGKLGTCEHSYCQSCLHAHIRNQIECQHEVIACPACQGSQPENPKGGANIDAARDGKETMPTKSQKTTAREKKTNPLVNSNCKLCHYKSKTAKAVSICKECQSIPLCWNCSRVHRKSIATKTHVVTCLASVKREEAVCIEHGEQTNLFCKPCSQTYCHICVSLNHADHEIETFNNVVFVEVDKVRIGMEHQEARLEMLKFDEKELQILKATAQEMEDVLIKSIEDHAENCIEEIIKNKEVLKKQVRTYFEVVRVMEKRLAAMPELQRVSRDVAAAANQLLNEQAELHSTYVEKLVRLKQQLDKLKEDHPAYEEDKKKYREAFKDVRQKVMTFYPRTPNCKIGGFKDAGPRCDAGGPCMCETCKKTLKWPNETRVVECRQKGTCTCRTCGCVYNRKKLFSTGHCSRCFHQKITVSDQTFP